VNKLYNPSGLPSWVCGQGFLIFLHGAQSFFKFLYNDPAIIYNNCHQLTLILKAAFCYIKQYSLATFCAVVDTLYTSTQSASTPGKPTPCTTMLWTPKSCTVSGNIFSSQLPRWCHNWLSLIYILAINMLIYLLVLIRAAGGASDLWNLWKALTKNNLK
jgi:hypothetical protein